MKIALNNHVNLKTHTLIKLFLVMFFVLCFYLVGMISSFAAVNIDNIESQEDLLSFQGYSNETSFLSGDYFFRIVSNIGSTDLLMFRSTDDGFQIKDF